MMVEALVDAQLSRVLSRPPWHVATTAEIAEATSTPFSTLSNWIVRGKFSPAEPRGLFHVDGNKRVYRIDVVTEHLSGVGSGEQALHYLQTVGLEPESSDVWSHIVLLERLNLFQHRWRPRDAEAYLATLPMK